MLASTSPLSKPLNTQQHSQWLAPTLRLLSRTTTKNSENLTAWLAGKIKEATSKTEAFMYGQSSCTVVDAVACVCVCRSRAKIGAAACDSFCPMGAQATARLLDLSPSLKDLNTESSVVDQCLNDLSTLIGRLEKQGASSGFSANQVTRGSRLSDRLSILFLPSK
ncbi:unnamed protein product [Dibothriocephalus latus]|uniref:Uncharacterized protein n=1 Tax=Dibothriocephalus latus TaxID=60516 RepID=A0A3P7NTY1_DIBLA|nr:unnamed protein product [Dibothriocephalus latus]